MTRIPDEYVNSVVYLYRTLDDAYEGSDEGGTGFLVSVPFDDPEWAALGFGYVYAVTNQHVAKDFPVLRFNYEGFSGVGPVAPSENAYWRAHPNGDDVAVFTLQGTLDAYKLDMVPTTMFVTPERLANGDFGRGDDCFMVGRYIEIDGRDWGNDPIVRFGNLAKPSTDELENDFGKMRDHFAVEMHSISGLSGSPVFIFQGGITDGSGNFHQQEIYRKVGLLGIDAGHLERRDSVYDGKNETRLSVTKDTLMASVIPAWKILDLLALKEFADVRKEQDDRLRKSGRKPPPKIKSDKHARTQESDYTRESFFSDLTKVTERDEPQDQED